MDRKRHEPTFSAPDLRDTQFQPDRVRHSRHQPARSDNGLVWKVALGVFLGMTACGLATCTVLGSLGYAVQKQQEAQVSKAIDDLNRIANDPDPMGLRKMAAEQQRQEALQAAREEQLRRPPPLGPDERCVGETRLRRIENGWVQAGSCR